MNDGHRGPSWVGIGAQRSGTTWFTDLLTSHPEVSLGRSGLKELHILERGLVSPKVEMVDSLANEFAGIEGAAGEFSPAYLRCLWIPELAKEVLPEDVVLFVLLRDPIDRFASAISHELRLSHGKHPPKANQLSQWIKFRGVDATWAGMYATQLDAWASCFPRERLRVIQYEAAAGDPESALAAAWAALGLEPVSLPDPTIRSTTTTSETKRWRWDGVEAFRSTLKALYEPEVQRLTADWGIERSLWPQFARPDEPGLERVKGIEPS